MTGQLSTQAFFLPELDRERSTVGPALRLARVPPWTGDQLSRREIEEYVWDKAQGIVTTDVCACNNTPVTKSK